MVINSNNLQPVVRSQNQMAAAQSSSAPATASNATAQPQVTLSVPDSGPSDTGGHIQALSALYGNNDSNANANPVNDSNFIQGGKMTSSLPDQAGAAALNSNQQATAPTAQAVAQLYQQMTGQATSVTDLSLDYAGPFKPDTPIYEVSVGGTEHNAGLVAKEIELYGPDQAMRMLQAELQSEGVSSNTVSSDQLKSLFNNTSQPSASSTLPASFKPFSPLSFNSSSNGNSASSPFIQGGTMTSSLPGQAGSAALNPNELATQETAQKMAQLLEQASGQQVTISNLSDNYAGPFKPSVPMYQLNVGGKQFNAGLVETMVQSYGATRAMQMMQAQMQN